MNPAPSESATGLSSVKLTLAPPPRVERLHLERSRKQRLRDISIFIRRDTSSWRPAQLASARFSSVQLRSAQFISAKFRPKHVSPRINSLAGSQQLGGGAGAAAACLLASRRPASRGQASARLVSRAARQSINYAPPSPMMDSIGADPLRPIHHFGGARAAAAERESSRRARIHHHRRDLFSAKQLRAPSYRLGEATCARQRASEPADELPTEGGAA